VIGWSVLRRIECFGLLGVSGIAGGWGSLRRIASPSACTGSQLPEFCLPSVSKAQ